MRDNAEKYGRAGQVTDDNMAHAHYMLDTYGYKYTRRICNTYCFFHCGNDCTNVPRSYVIRTLTVVFITVSYHNGMSRIKIRTDLVMMW